MQRVSEAEIFRACRTLFGPDLQVSRAFLSYLQPSGARSAYRKKAKVVHPDRFAIACTTTKNRQHRIFQDLNQAHQMIQGYLKHKISILPQPSVNKSSTYSQPQRQRHDPPKQHQNLQTLPRRPLQFGQFLYYLGIVPFTALISAITWQRRQRPVLGEIAKRWGWLSAQDINRIITYKGRLQRFGDRAEYLGLLSGTQVRTLLFHQRSLQKQIGDYFVEQGFFDDVKKDELLSQLAEHNRTYRNDFNQQFYYFHR